MIYLDAVASYPLLPEVKIALSDAFENFYAKLEEAYFSELKTV